MGGTDGKKRGQERKRGEVTDSLDIRLRMIRLASIDLLFI